MLRVGEDGIDERGGLVGGEPAIEVDLQQDGPLLLRDLAQLLALEGDLVVEQLALASDRDVLADAHAERPRDESGHPGEDDHRLVRIGSRDAHHQGQIGDEAVIRAEHDRSQDRVERRLVRGRRIRQGPFADRAVQPEDHVRPFFALARGPPSAVRQAAPR